jgi:hypothetical protein
MNLTKLKALDKLAIYNAWDSKADEYVTCPLRDLDESVGPSEDAAMEMVAEQLHKVNTVMSAEVKKKLPIFRSFNVWENIVQVGLKVFSMEVGGVGPPLIRLSFRIESWLSKSE